MQKDLLWFEMSDCYRCQQAMNPSIQYICYFHQCLSHRLRRRASPRPASGQAKLACPGITLQHCHALRGLLYLDRRDQADSAGVLALRPTGPWQEGAATPDYVSQAWPSICSGAPALARRCAHLPTVTYSNAEGPIEEGRDTRFA